MLSEQNQTKLAAMKLVETISASLGTGSWLWGGLVPDIFAKRLLRDHDDLDYLTWNLHNLQPALIERFSAQGWQATSLENGDLRLTKEGLKIHLGHIEIHMQVKWTHNGDQGYLLFPAAWLRMPPIKFYETEVHVVEPELQYVLKTHPELLNPGWKPREKDYHDRKILRLILQQKSTRLNRLANQVSSL